MQNICLYKVVVECLRRSSAETGYTWELKSVKYFESEDEAKGSWSRTVAFWSRFPKLSTSIRARAYTLTQDKVLGYNRWTETAQFGTEGTRLG